MIKQPEHYDGWKVGLFIHEMKLNFAEGNVVKYTCRWKKKDGLKDLYKARDYLNHLIQLTEMEQHVHNQAKQETTEELIEQAILDLRNSKASCAEVPYNDVQAKALDAECTGY